MAGERKKPDQELTAIRRIMEIMYELEVPSRDRVLGYVIHRSDEWKRGVRPGKPADDQARPDLELVSPPGQEAEGSGD